MIDYREDAKWTVYVHIVPKSISGYEWDKYYVGITGRVVYKRWCNGKGYSCNKYFTNAIEKYGWNNITHEIVAEHLTKDEACMMEKKLIKTLKSNEKNYGYNITDGGENGGGWHHTEETKQRMRENRQDITGENNPFYGKHHSVETKKEVIKS